MRKPQPARSARRSRPRRSALAGAILVLVLLAISISLTRVAHRPQIPDPPRVAELGPLDAEVAGSLREALEELGRDHRDPGAWGRFAMICEANGVVRPARDAYAAAAALDPSDARWWYRLASVESRLGRTDEAIRDVRGAIDANPQLPAAWWRLGSWLLDRNDTNGAERAFQQMTRIDSADQDAAIGLARVYLQRQEDARAIDVLERSLASKPGNRYAMQLLGAAYQRAGRSEEAAFALSVGAGGEPEINDPLTDEMLQFRRGFAVRLKDATAYYSAGRLDRAIALLEQLRQERPDDIALEGHLGEVYVVGGRTGEGVSLLQDVVKKDTDRFEAWVNLATGYMQLGDVARARTAIDRAIQISPTLGRAHETKALILWRQGDERAALASVEAAERYDPRNLQARIYRGMLEMNLARPSDALETFTRVTRLDPTRLDAWIGIANAEMSCGRPDRAEEALGRARHLNPNAPEVQQTMERLRSVKR